jgi:hypothetical protein
LSKKGHRVDIVRELIDRILEASSREGSFTESMALEIERSFRHEFKGAECVISERPRRDVPADAVRADYLADKPVQEITATHGISRATLYRLLKK